MTAYQYRAFRKDGAGESGQIEAESENEALALLRRQGVQPVELRVVEALTAKREGKSGANREAAKALIGELAVLLDAGLPLDRSLALAIGNIEQSDAAAAMAGLLKSVREGTSLSASMLARPDLFTPAEAAMAEAGEANGRLGEALGQLAAMLQSAAALRRLVVTSMIYPAALVLISVGVILMMLLFVVPQFDKLIETSSGEVPAASQAVIGASRFLREYGLLLLGALVAAVLLGRAMLMRPSARKSIDHWLLRLPLLGELLRRIDTARFAHVLGTLIEAGVPVPNALALARRTISNSEISEAVGKVADGVREGGGITGPIAAAKVFPPMAIGFLRTGEETSRLGIMLRRLADVLDRDIRGRLERLVAILTPAITVTLGAVVAGIIAAIMSAILGFNDLAVAQP